jgi:hypothetical protein
MQERIGTKKIPIGTAKGTNRDEILSDEDMAIDQNTSIPSARVWSDYAIH